MSSPLRRLKAGTRRVGLRAARTLARRGRLPRALSNTGDRIDRWYFARTVPTALLAREDLAVDRWGDVLRLTCLVEDMDARRALHENLDLVIDLCTQESIEHFVVRGRRGTVSCVGIRASDAATFMASLRTQQRDEPTYVAGPSQVGGGPRDPRTRLARAADLEPFEGLCRVASILVWRHYRVVVSGLRLGSRHACQVEFWDELPDGSLGARRPNRVTRLVHPEERGALIEVAGRHYPTMAPFAKRQLEDVTFPIDVVFTWVDGDDPAWLERRLALAGFSAESARAHISSIDHSRFRSRDELRFALRSVCAFAPWVRHIWLVTDRQVPEWLDTTQPGVTVVDHSAIFDRVGDLPVYNSHAIESRLHHIPGLAEHYLYLNDDVMLARAVGPELFFLSNGMSKFFLSRSTLDPRAVADSDTPLDGARKRTRDLLAGDLECAPSQLFKHAPHPQQKSLMLELEARYSADFARTSRSRFRDGTDIIVTSWLHHYYGYFMRRAVPGDISYDYLEPARSHDVAKMQQLLTRRRFDAFCLNDVASGEHDERVSQALLDFLPRYFPRPCRFELAVTETAPEALATMRTEAATSPSPRGH